MVAAPPKPRRQPKPKPVDPREESYYRWMGQRIARVRQHRRLTQQQLADKSGYTVASICSIEKGRQRTPLFELFRIGETLGLSDPRVLLPYLTENGDEDTHGPSDDTVDLDYVLYGPEMSAASTAFATAADLAEENAAIAQELGLGASSELAVKPEDWRATIEDSGASNEGEKQEEAPNPFVYEPSEEERSQIKVTLLNDPESYYTKCRLCGGPLVTRMDQEFQIHSEKCRQAETDAKRKENGTYPVATITIDNGKGTTTIEMPDAYDRLTGVAVTVGGATVRFDDPRIIPTPNPHKPEETAFQAGQYVWATREDAAGYLAAQDSGREGVYMSGGDGLRVLADDDPNVRRATGSESCGICSASIDPDAAILEVKGAGGMSTDVGPCCQQFYV